MIGFPEQFDKYMSIPFQENDFIVIFSQSLILSVSKKNKLLMLFEPRVQY